MTAQEFREALRAVDLRISAAARLFQVNVRTAARWAAGEQDVPAAVALALKLMVQFGVTADQAGKFLDGND